MSAFSDYDDLLGTECSLDAWADDVVLLAADALGRFTPRDWDQLSSTFTDHSTEWQIRAADTISDGPPEYGISILLKILDGSNAKVNMSVCESLRVLLEGRPRLVVSRLVHDRITLLGAESTGLFQQNIHRLLQLTTPE